ncbi:SubName: Full=Uncharacterized protein {ECO:0000313/EMBL:CCA74693.1} [Serendipita indica DSM 11827]|uniref:Transmembrane protein n=1 Tax=Serendipita indica (strain DSM 11827) TaxID=1109443 RepID=G4TTQ0_SERID|nr:SubName: Full=Uncharacterized protein {ECO:0000313/EMBL:CCA74693.1} [Serendipita indica DSM 11827]CCA74693.1 hypothetical protein PIIN_08644 [Serendipita indica DSM 11827]
MSHTFTKTSVPFGPLFTLNALTRAAIVRGQPSLANFSVSIGNATFTGLHAPVLTTQDADSVLVTVFPTPAIFSAFDVQGGQSSAPVITPSMSMEHDAVHSTVHSVLTPSVQVTTTSSGALMTICTQFCSTTVSIATVAEATYLIQTETSKPLSVAIVTPVIPLSNSSSSSYGHTITVQHPEVPSSFMVFSSKSSPPVSLATTATVDESSVDSSIQNSSSKKGFISALVVIFALLGIGTVLCCRKVLNRRRQRRLRAEAAAALAAAGWNDDDESTLYRRHSASDFVLPRPLASAPPSPDSTLTDWDSLIDPDFFSPHAVELSQLEPVVTRNTHVVDTRRSPPSPFGPSFKTAPADASCPAYHLPTGYGTYSPAPVPKAHLA